MGNGCGGKGHVGGREKEGERTRASSSLIADCCALAGGGGGVIVSVAVIESRMGVRSQGALFLVVS